MPEFNECIDILNKKVKRKLKIQKSKAAPTPAKPRARQSPSARATLQCGRCGKCRRPSKTLRLSSSKPFSCQQLNLPCAKASRPAD